MSNILGFSHLVFTVADNGIAGGSGFLDTLYDSEEYFELDHATHRSELVRAPQNLVSRISLYKSRTGDLPAIELLHVKHTQQRPVLNYGLISRHTGLPLGLPLERRIIPGTPFYVDGWFDPLLNTFIASQTNLFDDEKQAGCWMFLSDFEVQKKYFSGIGGKKILIDTADIFAVKCRVINKKLSSFVFVLINDRISNAEYYNDDLGLSTLGWFARNLSDESLAMGLHASNLFSISLNGNSFDARFLYNNKNISHEILKVN